SRTVGAGSPPGRHRTVETIATSARTAAAALARVNAGGENQPTSSGSPRTAARTPPTTRAARPTGIATTVARASSSRRAAGLAGECGVAVEPSRRRRDRTGDIAPIELDDRLAPDLSRHRCDAGQHRGPRGHRLEHRQPEPLRLRRVGVRERSGEHPLELLPG